MLPLTFALAGYLGWGLIQIDSWLRERGQIGGFARRGHIGLRCVASFNLAEHAFDEFLRL
jgi:hypothetical protein